MWAKLKELANVSLENVEDQLNQKWSHLFLFNPYSQNCPESSLYGDVSQYVWIMVVIEGKC